MSHDVNLAECTFFGTGGLAETFITIEDTSEIDQVLKECKRPIWFLGSGANVLISDKGLPGTTLHLATSSIEFDGDLVIADAGAKWDGLVVKSLEHSLWGLINTSGVPGTVGAAIVGNIAAYGEAVSDTLSWVEVIDTSSKDHKITKLSVDQLEFNYRFSSFQKPDFFKYLIVRAGFKLRPDPKPLEYASAKKVAEELKLDANDLEQRRKIILETRSRIGALVDKKHHEHNAGSFFRNPVVSPDKAEYVMQFDEHHIKVTESKKQNLIHGGSTSRVSAAHVLLAAGFKRGQSWGPVRLHPDHILKIENTGDATSQQIYDVAQEIIKTVKDKLDIDLIPEVRFLGDFN